MNRAAAPWYLTSLIAGAATRGLPFLALLIYAAKLGPDDFAQISMLAVASAWLTLLASGGLEFTAMFGERQRLGGSTPHSLQNAWFVAAPLSLASGLVFVCFALLVGFPLGPWLVMVCSAIVLGLVQLPLLGRARIRHDKRTVALLVVVPFALAASLRLLMLFAVPPDSSISPLWLWVSGDITQALVVVLLAIPVLLRSKITLPGGQSMREGLAAVRQSGPWLINAGLLGALANLDKFLLYGLVPAEAFGVYALSYQLANIANILVSEYNKARLGSIVRNSIAGLHRSISRETVHYLGVLLVGGVISVSAALVLFQSNYPDVGWLTLLLVCAVLPVALYVPLENQIAVVGGRTTPLAIASAVGVALGAVTLLILVSPLGVIAGVIGTAVGYTVTSGVLLWLLHRSADNPRPRAIPQMGVETRS